MTKGTKLWQEAKQIIPGGNQLLSKRSEMFLPEYWPAYYSRAKGCEVWDLDHTHYYDFAQMGVGSCVLGYADPDINQIVKQAIDDGGMSTLNCREEVELAQKLIELHPWSQMARFCRTGGEACAVAVRIARAATEKDKVAFCGYHGWHDWYLSSNLANSANLDGQLLPGLDPKGVPRPLKGTSLPFNYNSLDELEKIVAANPDLGVIVMEPVRDKDPEMKFLKGVREIASRIGAALIFDEVTSGFRMNLGGIHLTYGVDPDLAVFGKALGNGFPISAVIGRKKFMDAAQESFISSTFWTERIGFAAGLAVLDKMKRYAVQSKLIEYGKRINTGWLQAARAAGLEIGISGIEPLTHIHFKGVDPLAQQTFFTQEMLKKGYLAGAAVYTTFAYSPEIIDGYLKVAAEVFANMSAILKQQGSVVGVLAGPIKHSGFKRLN